IYDHNHYKSAQTVIHMLVDVVSKNGNLLLSVPLRGDGSLDDKARTVVEGIANWMKINAESIIGTRPWHVFGEGPAQEDAPELHAQGFNEGKGKPFTSDDIRFTQKGNTLYAIIMGVSDKKSFRVTSLGKEKANQKGVNKVEILGYNGDVKYKQSKDGLDVFIPRDLVQHDIATVLKIT